MSRDEQDRLRDIQEAITRLRSWSTIPLWSEKSRVCSTEPEAPDSTYTRRTPRFVDASGGIAVMWSL